mgnify:FL=1
MLLILEDCSARSDDVSAELQLCEANYLRLLEPVDNLREFVGTRKQVLSPLENNVEREMTSQNGGQTGSDAVHSADLLELQGEN